MNRRIIMIALGALVAGAFVLVYAEGDKGTLQRISAATASGLDVAVTGATQAPPPAGAPQVLYDFNALPDPVKRMLTSIAGAAESGNIEAMRTVFESNELKPMVTTSFVDDPIAFWKKASADGTGRDVLAAMLNVLSSGYVRMGKGKDEIFVWPYFAETDLAKLTPAQEVELYRIVPPELALAMKTSGKYSYYRLGVSPTGVWQYFLQ
ncbi:MAG TPA: hypothetical protein VK193_05895 [Methyloceanibacter sp.]|jgi:hypothetical protein|nr:hypothetical protein [Methyloceanibacter sp.]